MHLRHGHHFPTGTVIPYAGLLASTDTDAAALKQIQTHLSSSGWLSCDGSSYPCADYPRLYGVIGKSFGYELINNVPHFRVPDLRGRFMRGVDGGQRHDPDAGKRTPSGPSGPSGDHVGTLQADAFQGHEHHYTSTKESLNTAEPGGPAMLMQLELQTTTGIEPFQPDPGGQPSNDGTPRISSETRPLNLGLNFLIRWP